jgi:hypothetical protein
MSTIGKPPLISLGEHPGASAGIRRAKAWGGLLSFFGTAVASYRSGLGADGAALRAIGGGIVGYLVCWGVAIAVWRAFVNAEIRAAVERIQRRRAEAEPRTHAGGGQ